MTITASGIRRSSQVLLRVALRADAIASWRCVGMSATAKAGVIRKAKTKNNEAVAIPMNAAVSAVLDKL